MRILLINSNRFAHPEPVIPFGLCCVAASLEARNHDVKVLDLCFSRNPGKAVKKAVAAFHPQLVGISVRNIDNGVGYNTMFLLEQVKKNVVAPCKQVFSGPIVVGGPAVGINGPELLDFFGLDMAICGDGELATAELVERIEKGLPLDGVEGLIRRKDGVLQEKPAPARVPDLNRLPRVRLQQYIDVEAYRKVESPLLVQTKRGCPLKCSYCTYNKIEGRKYRLREPQAVAGDIEMMVEETGIDHIEFADSTFNLPLDHAKAVLRNLLKKKLNLNLRTMGLNPGAVDEELFELMKEVGFAEVDIGAESGNDEMLRSLGKNFTRKDILRTGKLLQSFQIPARWFFLLGAPGETLQTLRDTFDTIEETVSSDDLVVIAVGIRIYKGTPIAAKVQEDNPEIGAQGFLYPVSYQSDLIDIDTIKKITTFMALDHPNYYTYDGKTGYPILREIVCFVRRTRGGDGPIWQKFIRAQVVFKSLGFLKIAKSYCRFRHSALWRQWQQTTPVSSSRSQ